MEKHAWIARALVLFIAVSLLLGCEEGPSNLVDDLNALNLSYKGQRVRASGQSFWFDEFGEPDRVESNGTWKVLYYDYYDGWSYQVTFRRSVLSGIVFIPQSQEARGLTREEVLSAISETRPEYSRGGDFGDWVIHYDAGIGFLAFNWSNTVSHETLSRIELKEH